METNCSEVGNCYLNFGQSYEIESKIGLSLFSVSIKSPSGFSIYIIGLIGFKT